MGETFMRFMVAVMAKVISHILDKVLAYIGKWLDRRHKRGE